MTGGDSFDGAVLPWAGISAEEFLDSFGNHQEQLQTLYADDFGASAELGASRLFGDARYEPVSPTVPLAGGSNLKLDSM